MSLHIVILAAGRGQRMRSKYPKVLHHFAGIPILERILQTIQKLNPQGIHVIYGHGGDLVPKTLTHYAVHWYQQDHLLGTAHALAQALPNIPSGAKVLVLVGDIPLISAETLQRVIHLPHGPFGLLTAFLENPTGLGRILRNAQGDLIGIVEEKDTTVEQRSIQEVNTGIIQGIAESFKTLIPRLNNQNAQGEYYLTDVINLAIKDGQMINSIVVEESQEVMGINDRIQLEQLERYYYQKVAKSLMLKGVTLADAARFDLRGTLEIGQDNEIDIDVVFEGQVIIGSGCKIGPFSILKNVVLGNHVEIKSHCVLEGAKIEDHCVVGPFARIRPATTLSENAHIGNFVEIKNAEVGKQSKINHLSYVGDATIGQNVNVGAGTITCNYDGVAKYHTTIEDNAFIGSDTQLIAPVTIGKGSIIGAGSTITRDTPDNTLTLSRVTQKSVSGWKRSKKL